MTKKNFPQKIDIEALVEAACRRLLKEYSPTPEEEAEIKHSQHVRTLIPLAVFVQDDGSEKTAILYSPEDVDKLIRQFRDAEKKRKEDYKFYWKKIRLADMSIEGAVRGIIQIKEPSNPCWGAWEVIASAGPGGADIARTVYGLGYALSPSGVIMPDRASVSGAAKAAWARVADKGGRKVLPLDDISLPVERRRTPDFPDDDCKLYTGKSKDTDPNKNPHLQNAYAAQGWERGMLRFLTAAHESFMDDLAAEDPELPEMLEKYMIKSAYPFFKHHYPGPDND